MKTVSASFEAQEIAITRRPVELYHAWSEQTGEHWRFTTADEAVSYGGHTFLSAAISRGGVEYKSDFEASRLSVSFGVGLRPASDFYLSTPPANLWLEVLRLYLDQDPSEAVVIFVGQVSKASLKGAGVSVECVGLEWFLSRPVPVPRYQAQCNHTLFDARCGVSRADYEVLAMVDAVSSDGLIVTSSSFGEAVSGHFVRGEFLFGNQRRLIVEHAGENITLRYPVSGLSTGVTVTVWAGCDGNIETCYSRFNNVANFGGFPYIPADNPATWR